MGVTSDGDESFHRRLSSGRGECVSLGAPQATGLLQGLHPDADAQRLLQPRLRQAEEDDKTAYQ